MNTQADLPLPPASQPKVLTIEQLRDLICRAQAELVESSPAMKAGLAVLSAAAPESRRAALTALYAVANEDERRLIRTLRALAQLYDNEAHASRQPGRTAPVTIAPLAVATASSTPIPDPFHDPTS